MSLPIAGILLVVGLQAPMPREQSDASRFGIAGRILKVGQYSMSARSVRGRKVSPGKRDLVLVTTFDRLGNETEVEYYADGQMDSFIEKTTSPDRRREVGHVREAGEFPASIERGSAPPAPTDGSETWSTHHAESKLTRGIDGRLVGEEVVTAEVPFLPVGRQIASTYRADGRLAEERITFPGEGVARVVTKYTCNGAGDVIEKEGFLQGKRSYRDASSDHAYDAQHNWTRRTVRSVDASGKVQVRIEPRLYEYDR